MQVIHSDYDSARNKSESESEPRSDRTVIHLRMPHYLLFSLKRLVRSKHQGVTEIILDIFREYVFGMELGMKITGGGQAQHWNGHNNNNDHHNYRERQLNKYHYYSILPGTRPPPLSQKGKHFPDTFHQNQKVGFGALSNEF